MPSPSDEGSGPGDGRERPSSTARAVGEMNSTPAPTAELERARQAFLRDNPPRRLLVNSVPKSGTTWTVAMLSMLPGYERFPMERLEGTRPEELLNLQPGQVFHGHIMSSPGLFEILAEREIRAVYVYRDLRDVVVSNYFHLSSLNPKRAPVFFRTMSKEELFKAENLLRWCASCKRYVDVQVWKTVPGVPVVSYEALKADAVGELHRLLAALGFKAEAALVRHIVEETSFEKMSGREVGQEDPRSPQRKGVVGDWKNHFSAENALGFKLMFGDLLIDCGYEKDFLW